MPFPLIPLLLAGGSLLTGAARGSADERKSNNDQAAQRNSLLAQLHGQRQAATSNALNNQSSEQIAHAGIDLDRRNHALNAPDTRMSQSVRGSILKNAQPISFSGLPERVSSRIPQISGGLTPEMFSDETRQLGDVMTRKALIDQLRGDDFAPMEKTDFTGGVLPSPQLEGYEKSGFLEKIMAGLGLGGTVAGGIGEIIKNNRRAPLDNPFDAAG